MTRRSILAGAVALFCRPAAAFEWDEKKKQDHTIRLEGVVLQTFSEAEEMVLRVERVTLADGKVLLLSPARAKCVLARDADLGASAFEAGQSLIITGEDLGRGRPLKALTIALAAQTSLGVIDAAPNPDESTPLSTSIVLSDGTLVEGKQLLNLVATGYGPGENGEWGDRTKLETTVGFGTVAVDPRVIPLRSRLYVEGYGFALAYDIGGAIKGNRIDLGFNSDEEAADVGRKKVRVLILS
jgi:3D (Asp-Asp-Asp) domain-containing protein